MDEQKQIIKSCHVCGYGREYNNYHTLYVACKNCAKIRCAKHYQKKLMEKAKFYRKNNKDKPKQNRKSFSSHAEDIQNLYKKIDVIT